MAVTKQARGGTFAVELLVAVLVGVGVLALLRAWRYPAPCPGETLTLLAGAGVAGTPIGWRLLAQAVMGSGGPAAFARMQTLGHLLLAATAALHYLGVVLFVRHNLEDPEPLPGVKFVVRLAALGSVLCLVAFPSVWRAAQEFRPAIFGLFLVASTTLAVVCLASSPSAGAVALAAGLAGLAIVESPLGLLAAPVWFLIASSSGDSRRSPGEWTAWESEPFPWSVAATVLLATVVLSSVAAAILSGAARGPSGIVHYGLWLARNHLIQLRGGLPLVAWIAVVAALLAPCLAAVALARRVQGGDFGGGFMALYLVLSAAAVLQFMGPEALQLWRTVDGGVPRAGSGYLVALTIGLVLGPWLLQGARMMQGSGRTGAGANDYASSGNSESVSVFQGLAGLAVGVGLLVAVALALPQRREVDIRQALHAATAFVAQSVEDAEGCNWLATDGPLDLYLQMAAGSSAHRPRQLALRTDRAADAENRNALLLPDLASRELLRIEPVALLREWAVRQPAQLATVAAQTDLALWDGIFGIPLPNRSLFRVAAQPPTPFAALALLEAHRPFWRQITPLFLGTETCENDALAKVVASARRHAALVANELGYLLQDAGHDDEAIEAYTAARDIDPQNLSARLNLLTLHRRALKVPRSDGLAQEIHALLGLIGDRPLTETCRLHGRIRNAEVMVALTVAALRDGSAPTAISRLDAALGLAPGSSIDEAGLRTVRAVWRWRDGRAEDAREELRRLQQSNPDAAGVSLASAAFAVLDGQPEQGRAAAERARAAGAPAVVCDEVLATALLAAGKVTEAKSLLDPHVTGRTAAPSVWYLWAKCAQLAGDAQSVALARVELERTHEGGMFAGKLAGEGAERSGDPREAVANTRQALARNTGDCRLLATTISQYMEFGDLDAARPHAERLLARRPGHPLAHYALGTEALLGGYAERAEFHLARSADAAPNALVLNNLACARLELGRLEEARSGAKRAADIAPWHSQVWDTLSAVALRQGDLRVAEDAARQALVLAPALATSWLRLAEALIAAGGGEEALECVRQALSQARFAPSSKASERLQAARKAVELLE